MPRVRATTPLLAVTACLTVALCRAADAAASLTRYGCFSPSAASAVIHTPSAHGDAFLCGADTWLTLQVEIPSQDEASITSDTSFPLPLSTTKDACTLHDRFDLPIVASHVSAIKDGGKTWVVDLNCSFPGDVDATEFVWDSSESSLTLTCSLATSERDIPIQTALPPFLFLSDEYELAGLELMNDPPTQSETNMADAPSATIKSSSNRQLLSITTPASTGHHTAMVGIKQVANFQIRVTGDHATARATSLSGTCIINGRKSNVTAGRLDYTVQEGDSDLVGLTYDCKLEDATGIAPSNPTGLIQNEILQVDGSSPVLEDSIFALFSSEKPAHIGTVISITLRAENLTVGYTGVCEVNGVKDVPLLEAKDQGFYMIQYTVSEGDRSAGDKFMDDGHATMPLVCVVQNRAGNEFVFQKQVSLGFFIDAIRPKMETTSILFSSDRPAHEGTIVEIQITFSDSEPNLGVVSNESCLVNNVSVGGSFTRSTSKAFLLTYVVGEGEATWKAGELGIHCNLRDEAGNIAIVDRFTDGNTLFARELKPTELDTGEMMSFKFFPDKMLILSFIIVGIASHSIAKVCPHIGLPQISGYIFTGILVGPYVLNFLSTTQIRQLRIVDELSMAYIGLTAGSKLHWNHMRPMMKSILAVTFGLTVVEYFVGTITITVLAGYIEFLQDTSDSELVAIALLAGCMMIARSPSSALAVIEETKSQGHFTTLIFAVTVMCDVLVIFLFNVNSMITENFLSEKDISGDDFLRLMLQLCGSIGVGVVLGKIMGVIVLWRHIGIKRKSMWFKAMQMTKQALILLYGWMIFVICHLAHPYLEPLLCCMVSGAIMWNTSANPEELSLLLKKLADLVYVSFFTITGATLELDMLAKAIALSLVLCVTRVGAIFLGSYLGGVVAGEDPRHSKVAWMAYITQAGVTLGLAKQIQLMYPGWGSYFSTMIVAVVICNQIVGPPLLRYVLRLVGDVKKKEVGKVDGLSALVIGATSTTNLSSAILRLETCGWNVHSHQVTERLSEGKEHIYLSQVTSDVCELMQSIKPLEVVVVMMPTDRENFEVVRAVANACQKLRRITVLRVVVQVAGVSTSPSGMPTPRASPTSTPVVTAAAQWAARFAEMPGTEEHGDSIDVVVVDRVEANDMLIELAACGKVVNIADKMASTALSMGESETDLESGDQPARLTRLRESLKLTVRRLALV